MSCQLEPPARDGKPGGDPMRTMGAQREGKSLMWALVSRNKRTVTCDPATPAGRALLHRLVAAADVVVENLPAPTLAKWGATPDELSADALHQAAFEDDGLSWSDVSRF